MGLKGDIYKALVKNLGEEFINDSTKGQKKVDVLANDLSIAIRDFIKAQTFTVTKLQASQQAVTTTPSLTIPTGIPQPPGAPTVPSNIPSLVIPNITVKIDENAQASDNAYSGTESQNSAVRLIKEVKV